MGLVSTMRILKIPCPVQIEVSDNYLTSASRMDKNLTTLRTVILQGREALGDSQQDFAQKVGVSKGTISNWENGLTFPTAKDLYRLAEVLQVSVLEMLGEQPLSYFSAGKWVREAQRALDEAMGALGLPRLYSENTSPNAEHIGLFASTEAQPEQKPSVSVDGLSQSGKINRPSDGTVRKLEIAGRIPTGFIRSDAAASYIEWMQKGDVHMVGSGVNTLLRDVMYFEVTGDSAGQRPGTSHVLTTANGKPVTRGDTTCRWWRDLRKLAELPDDCDSLCLRKQCEQDLLDAGFSIADVVAIMGHSYATMRKHYARVDRSRRVDIMAQVATRLFI